MADRALKDEPGPFRVDQVQPGERYELSDGHAIYCAPTGGDGARSTGVGFEALDTDPAVDSAGVDAGYALNRSTLRAPDLSVGGVPDKPGWIPGVPPLAVEYAGVGQDEEKLQAKINDLLSNGTRFLWVVRLVGPRRVEIYEPNRPVRTATPGEQLLAPGVLQNPVPVEALYDRSAAHEVALRNLLQRKGYADLDEVRGEGREEERRTVLRRLLTLRFGPLPEVLTSRIADARPEELTTWLDRVVTAASAAEVLEPPA